MAHRYITTAEGNKIARAISTDEERRISDLIPDPVNTKVLFKNGQTRDIIKEVLQTYADSRNQLKEMGKMFQGKTLLETCNNIFTFWKKNVTYKIDPEGVQWIKTPSAFWNEGRDPFGDCKSFSIACAASLHALELKGAFRFVSFGNNTTAPTHVFVVVKDPNGNEIIIDCVWHTFNSTKAYRKKWDYNMTAIYRISGINTNNNRGILDVDSANADGLTMAELEILARKQRLELEQMIAVKKNGIGSTHDTAYEVEIMAANNALAQLGALRGNNKFRHRNIVNFGTPGLPRKRVPQVAPQNLMATRSAILDYDDDAVGKLFGKKKAAGVVKPGTSAPKKAAPSKKVAKQIKRNEAGKGISKKNAKKLEALNVVVKKKKDSLLKAVSKVVTAPLRLAAQGVLKTALPKNAPFFLYLFLADPKDPVKSAKILSKLPDVVMQKRQKALLAKDSIVKKIGMKETTFNDIVRSGIMQRFGMKPEDVLAKWMKDANFSVGFVEMALSFAGKGLSIATSALGLDFKNFEDAVPDPSDWGSVSIDTKIETANEVKKLSSNEPLVKDETVEQIIEKNIPPPVPQQAPTSTQPVYAPQQPAPYVPPSPYDTRGSNPGDASGDTSLNDIKEEEEVKVTAKRKIQNSSMVPDTAGEANTGLFILGGLALLAMMSGGPKKRAS